MPARLVVKVFELEKHLLGVKEWISGGTLRFRGETKFFGVEQRLNWV
jgi:hypothetical protein